MTKNIGPLFSLTARKSVGNTITYTRRQRTNVAMKIPTHPDARTLPQLYHRWRFVDARYYWHSLSHAQRAAYSVTARPLFLTGWAYFLSIYLKAPIDQMLWLRLDQPAANAVRDYSGQGNNGIITGAVAADGIINGCLQFDGVDDRVTCPTDTTLNPDLITITAWVYPTIMDGRSFGIATKWQAAAKTGYLFRHHVTNVFRFQASGGVAWPDISVSTINLYTIPNRWYHVAVTFDGDIGRLYVNGTADGTAATTFTIAPCTTRDLWVGRLVDDNRDTIPGKIDDVRIYNRPLSAQHIAYIATQELYPA